MHCTLLIALASFATGNQNTAPVAQEPAEPALRVASADAFQGFTLIAPINSHAILLLDMKGEIVHRWEADSAPGGTVELLDNGHLLRHGRDDANPRFHGGGIAGHLQEIGWDGKIVWKYELANDQRTAHHDFARLPNGNLLLIAWEYHSRDELIAAGRDPAQVGDEGLWPDMLLEIRPTQPEGAEVVWEWHAWDHLIQDFDPARKHHGKIAEHPELIDLNLDHRYESAPSEAALKKKADRERQMRALGYAGGNDPHDAPPGKGEKKLDPDWLHTNSVDYSPALDLVLLGSPHTSEIWVIDHSTTTAQAATHAGGRYGKGGDLLYRWGNPRNYGAGGAAQQTLFAQHDAQWLPGKSAGEWRVLVFNNGAERPKSEHSSVDELVLPFDAKAGFTRAAGAAFAPAAPTWTYAQPGTFFSPFISGAQRLPNGDTLVCSGAQARVFEVKPDGTVVWDYQNPHGGEIEPSPKGGKAPPKALFRATRIARDHPGLAGRTL